MGTQKRFEQASPSFARQFEDVHPSAGGKQTPPPQILGEGHEVESQVSKVHCETPVHTFGNRQFTPFRHTSVAVHTLLPGPELTHVEGARHVEEEQE